jgi:hypothetical protein
MIMKSLVYVGVNPIEIPALNNAFSKGDIVTGEEALMEQLRERSPADWKDAPKSKKFKDEIVEK